MNRIDRLMGITLMLQTRRVLRAEDIAKRWEISLRTVYRDVAALSEVGVPIAAEAGVGYRLMKGYTLPPIMFSEDEAAALGMAAMALSRTSDPSLDASMSAALMKVKAALPETQRDRLEKLERSVRFGWNDSAKKQDGAARLLDVQSCLCESRVLRIEYRTGGREELRSREVEPLGLVHYLEKWHLIAWCRMRGEVRDFRLDRIEKVERLSERFTRREGLSLDDYLERDRCMEKPVRVRAAFRSYAVDRAKREWSLGLQAEEPTKDGAELLLTTGRLEWMVGWLLSFRDQVTILEPLELRRMLAEEARKAAEHHASC